MQLHVCSLILSFSLLVSCSISQALILKNQTGRDLPLAVLLVNRFDKITSPLGRPQIMSVGASMRHASPEWSIRRFVGNYDDTFSLSGYGLTLEQEFSDDLVVTFKRGCKGVLCMSVSYQGILLMPLEKKEKIAKLFALKAECEEKKKQAAREMGERLAGFQRRAMQARALAEVHEAKEARRLEQAAQETKAASGAGVSIPLALPVLVVTPDRLACAVTGAGTSVGSVK